MHKILVRVNEYIWFLFVCMNMIRTLTFSHAEDEGYITARNSRVVYIEVFSCLFSASILINSLQALLTERNRRSLIRVVLKAHPSEQCSTRDDLLCSVGVRACHGSRKGQLRKIILYWSRGTEKEMR